MSDQSNLNTEILEKVHSLDTKIQALFEQPPDKFEVELSNIRADIAHLADMMVDIKNVTSSTQNTLNNTFEQRRAQYEALVSVVKETATETRLGMAADQKSYYTQLKVKAQNQLTVWSAIKLLGTLHHDAVIIGLVGMFAGVAMGMVQPALVEKVLMAYATGLGALGIYAIKVWVSIKTGDNKLNKPPTE